MGTEKRERQKELRRQRLATEQEAAVRARRTRGLIRFGVLAAVVVGIIVLYSVLSGGGDDDTIDLAADDSADSTDTPATDDGVTVTTGPSYTTFAEADYGSGECPPATGIDAPVIDFTDSPQLCIEPGGPLTAVFDTSEGEIRVALDTANTTGTANNFATLARYGYYDATEVFRTDPSIGILQAGSPHTNSASDPGPGYTIKDEGTAFSYEPGQLVMARSSGVDSAGAQIFFTGAPEAALLNGQGTYVVFGTVAEGLDVVETILGLHEDQPDNPLGGGPSRTVTINSVTIQ